MFNTNKNEIQQIPISNILPNPDQPRKVFNEENLNELATSIKEIGIMQPIIVKKGNDHFFTLIAGERRLRAAKIAGLNTVPVIVKELDVSNMALWALIENIQREDLNFIEEALAYKRLISSYQLTQLEISEKVGKNQSTISNKIRILNLPEEVQALLVEHKLTERHARALLKLPDKKNIHKALKKIIEKSLNVKETELLVESMINQNRIERTKSLMKKCINYKIYVNTVKRAFKTIKEVEECAEYIEEDKGEYMEIKIKIPKSEMVS